LYQPLAVLNWAPAMPSILVDTKVGEWFAGIARTLGVGGRPWPYLVPLGKREGICRSPARPCIFPGVWVNYLPGEKIDSSR